MIVPTKDQMARKLSQALGNAPIREGRSVRVREMANLSEPITILTHATHPLLTIVASGMQWTIFLERMEADDQVPEDAPNRPLPYWTAYTSSPLEPAAITRLATADLALDGALVAALEDPSREEDTDDDPNYSMRLRDALLEEQRRTAQA